MQKILATFQNEPISYFDDCSALFFIGYKKGEDHSKLENALIGRHAELIFYDFDTKTKIENPIMHSKKDFEFVNEFGVRIFHSGELIKDDLKFVEQWFPILDALGFNFRGSISMFDEYLKNYN